MIPTPSAAQAGDARMAAKAAKPNLREKRIVIASRNVGKYIVTRRRWNPARLCFFRPVSQRRE
jgi:hypothetical protein